MTALSYLREESYFGTALRSRVVTAITAFTLFAISKAVFSVVYVVRIHRVERQSSVLSIAV
jgi:hypothetical protein